jgi:hypothetical protein
MTEWTQYQHKGVIEARKWTDADMRAYANRESGISVSGADMESAIYQPPTGYVARNPDNHADQWYIAPEYFAKHYGAPSPVSALVEALKLFAGGECNCDACFRARRDHARQALGAEWERAVAIMSGHVPSPK